MAYIGNAVKRRKVIPIRNPIAETNEPKPKLPVAPAAIPDQKVEQLEEAECPSR